MSLKAGGGTLGTSFSTLTYSDMIAVVIDVCLWLGGVRRCSNSWRKRKNNSEGA